jgi:chloramphenicol 3-O phosphotransferase
MTHTSLSNQNAGKIIILDGTTTAGKSNIAQHLTTLFGGSYEQISIDDFHTPVFAEQKKLKLSAKEFLIRIRQASDAMYDKIIDLAAIGKVVIVDVILSGHGGEKDVSYALKKLNNFNVTLVLVYCPLVMVVERIKRRNDTTFA